MFQKNSPELSSLIELFAASSSPTWIVGDMNIHLKRATDSDSRKLAQLLETFNLSQLVREPIHALGGLLDAVIAPDEVVSNDVTVSDVGLSDHMLIHWSVTVSRPGVEYKTRLQRRWSTFNRDLLIQRLKVSELCCELDSRGTETATELADRY